MKFIKPNWTVGVPGKVFEALFEYLCSDVTEPQQAAIHLTSAVVDDPTDSSIDIGEKFKSLWGTFLWFTKQLPAEDKKQDQLVRLVFEIQKVPRPQEEELDEYEKHTVAKVWIGLPGFIPAIIDFEFEAPLVPRLRDRPDPYNRRANYDAGPWAKDLSPAEWTNVNAFVARIHASSPQIIHLDVRGLLVLLDALEERQTAKVLDDLVPTAACWIIYAGTALKNNSIEYAIYPESGAKRMPFSVGELYHGPKAFNDTRWAFWKTRFRELMTDEDLKPETRSYAQKAWEEM